MIVKEMNRDEIHAHFKNDLKLHGLVVAEELRKAEKLVRKMPCYKFCRVRKFKSKESHQNYICYTHKHTNVKGLASCALYAVLNVTPTKNNYYSFTNEEYMDVLTSHCIERYGERMKITGNDEDIIKEMLMNSTFDICIYENKNTCHCVYARTDGLMLAVFDYKKKLIVNCTFVSIDMLKPSQLAAFNKVKGLLLDKNMIKRMSERTYNAENISKSKEVLDLMATIDEYAKEADEIYKMHFESNLLI